QVLAAIVLAATGAWQLARTLGAGSIGSAISALSFSLSGYLTSETANAVYLWGAALLPLTLASFVRGARQGWDRRAFYGAIFSSASTLLMGDLQSAYCFTGIVFLFGFLFVQGRGLRYLAGASILGLLIAGLTPAQLLPSWYLLKESVRAAGIAAQEASYWSLHPLRIPELLLAHFSPIGDPGRARALFDSVPGYLLWAEALGGSAIVSFLAIA